MTELKRAFEAKARGVVSEGSAVGFFGSDFPVVLVAACGLRAVDVEMEPAADAGCVSAAVDEVAEPFVDASARRFLHRLLCGAYDDLAAIVFSRSTAAAYIAYLYATELRRQQRGAVGPLLHLWNGQLTDSDAVAAFNRSEAHRLEQTLASIGGSGIEEGLPGAVAAERQRAEALAGLERTVQSGRISGHDAMRWRNAGRYLDAAEHARLLKAATDERAENGKRAGRRIGLIGSPVAESRLYDLIEEFGTIVADPHSYGFAWPPPVPSDAADIGAVLEAAATHRLQPRALPVAGHRQAIVRACVEAGCDAAVIQLDPHDDTVGWDLPDIRARLHAAGIRIVDLGFRPDPVDEAWLEAARGKLREALA